MKKLTYTTAIFMAVAATSVFAHHPSEDVNPNFDMVDAQLEAVESPHYYMDMDDMGANTAAGDSDMANASQESFGEPNTSRPGLANQERSDTAPGPAAAADTIDLLENVE